MAGWLLPQLGVHLGVQVSSARSSTRAIGAVIVLVILSLIKALTIAFIAPTATAGSAVVYMFRQAHHFGVKANNKAN